MITIRDRDFKIVRTSQNLRGIITHSNENAVKRLDLFACNGGTGKLGVTWINGDSTVADFASFSVMRMWVKGRRAFRGIEPNVHKGVLEDY